MEKYKEASFYTLIAFLIISVSATFLEWPLIHYHHSLYLGGKIFFHLWLAWLCVLVRRNAYNTRTNLQVGIMMMTYTIHGQFFSPWYMFVFHELIIAFSFLFPLPRRVFTIFAIFFTAVYSAVMWSQFDIIYNWVNMDSRIEWLISAIAIMVVAILAHTFFTADRNQREDLVRKFGLVGLQTATVVHDVKSMLASPRMNIDILKKRLSAVMDGEVQSLLNSVEFQLTQISNAMSGLNQVVSLQQQEKEIVSFRKLIGEVSATMNLEARKVTLDIVGDFEIYSEKALLKSIVFNILMNSIQAFRKNQIPQARVTVFCSSSSLIFCDNAGGYPEEILAALERDGSTGISGPGMGLFLISNAMQSLGGKVFFSNLGEGVHIRLDFPAPGLRKAHQLQ